MSRPIVNRKNCLGDVAAVYNPENVNNFFPLQIFPNLASTYLESVSLSLVLNYTIGASAAKKPVAEVFRH